MFVAVVDYGMGNLDSVRRAVQLQGSTVTTTADPQVISEADRIILPGVGAFGEAMNNLRRLGLDETLTQHVLAENVPFLGVCLGMQLMARSSTEHGDHEGLGWLDCAVVKLEPSDTAERVPHVGWNEVHPTRDDPLFHGIDNDRDFYFVHSFHVATEDDDLVLATTPYAGGFNSVIGTRNMFGVQFHPEKSQQAGQLLLKNFLTWKG